MIGGSLVSTLLNVQNYRQFEIVRWRVMKARLVPLITLHHHRDEKENSLHRIDGWITRIGSMLFLPGIYREQWPGRLG